MFTKFVKKIGLFSTVISLIIVYNISKKSEMVSTNTLHNVRQRNIVYSKALRNVCLNITYANTLHNVRQRNIV